MFTARDFLKLSKGGDGEKWRMGDRYLSSDPDRFRSEFLAIVSNPSEPDDLRASSLMVLWVDCSKLNTFGSSDVAETLIAVFEKEFPTDRLKAIASSFRGGNYCAQEFPLLLQFAAAFVKIVPNGGREIATRIKDAMQGTWFEPGLAKMLAAGNA